MTAANTHKSVIENVYADLGRGSLDVLMDSLHDDIEWFQDGDADLFTFSGPHHGKWAVAACMTAMNTAFPPIGLRILDIIAEDDKVCVRCQIERAASGDGPNIQSQSAHFFTFENGKIRRFREIFDTASALRQMGRLVVAVPEAPIHVVTP
jgi:ketosteroid isomerase-like protein